jgi:peptidoglycan hydrolase-like protein with peptidoglycan-binding domain
MSQRPYTGYNATASGKRAGFEMLVDLLEAHFGLWSNGTFGVRPKRGKSSMSVHATGRAGDLSWRGAPYRGTGNYQDAVRMMDWLTEHADGLEIEAIFDYYPQPWGRGYKCDRDAWSVYDKKAFSGAPGGDWVHIEVSEKYADDSQYYADYFKEHLGETDVSPAPVKKTPKKPADKDPWLQVGSKGEKVKEVQGIVGATQDGDYGPKTEEAVKKWQAEHDLHVDGIWGPGSDGHYADCKHGKEEAPEAPKAAEKVITAAPYPGKPLNMGSRGDDVKLVQAKLSITVDGRFGKQTQRFVKSWQSKNNLFVDGIVGPKTWKHMFG